MERGGSAKENINPLKHMEDFNADMSVDSLAPELTESAPWEQATPAIPVKEQLLTDELSTNETDLASGSIDLASESIDLSRSLGPALVGTSSFETTPTAQASSSDRTQSPPVQVQIQPSQGGAETEPELAGILGDVTNQQKPFIPNEDSNNKAAATVRGNATDAQLSGDSGSKIIREAEEYADDLARELIKDTNELVRSGHSVGQLGNGENKEDSDGEAAQEEEKVAAAEEEKDASVAGDAGARSSTTEGDHNEGAALAEANASANADSGLLQESQVTNQGDNNADDDVVNITGHGGAATDSANTVTTNDHDSSPLLDNEESNVAETTNNTTAGAKRDSQDHSLSAEAVVVGEIDAPDTTQQQQQQQRDDQNKIEPELEQEAELVSRKEIDDFETIVDPEIIENRQEEEEIAAAIFSSKRQSSVSEGLLEEEQDIPVAKLVNKTNITTNVFDAHQSFQTAAGNSLIDCDSRLLDEMEFTKNYSDDLLMGRNDGSDQQGEILSAGANLADFELPPYSGSSSGSEQPPKQLSPTKRKSSSSSAQQASSSQHVSVAQPNLTAVKNLLLSSYSRVSHVFHWKKPIESGVFFTIGITLVTTLTFFSIISVVAYTALGAIFTSSLIRVYKAVMKTLKRSQETPFDQIWNKILSLNVSMSPEKMHELVDVSLGNFNASLVYFKQVLLVEDKLATLKFGVFLYLLTYIGSWFNGMTLITISYLALFSVPVFYEKNKANIDEHLNLVSGQISTTASLITNKISSLVFGSSPLQSTSGTKKQE